MKMHGSRNLCVFNSTSILDQREVFSCDNGRNNYGCKLETKIVHTFIARQVQEEGKTTYISYRILMVIRCMDWNEGLADGTGWDDTEFLSETLVYCWE